MQQKEITILNKQGAKLEGLLHDAKSTHVVVLCHAFRSSKEHSVMVKLAGALEDEGISVFRFDFSVTQYTEDSYYSGNYDSEIEDLRAVVEYLSTVLNRPVGAVLGHSKGANIVLEYASKYQDVGAVINVSGRYDPWHINLKCRTAPLDCEVTEGKVINKDANIDQVWLTIHPNCKVLTVHGTADVDVDLEEAYEIGKVIPNHRLVIVEGANHPYHNRLDQLAAAVVAFAKEYFDQLAKDEEDKEGLGKDEEDKEER